MSEEISVENAETNQPEKIVVPETDNILEDMKKALEGYESVDWDNKSAKEPEVAEPETGEVTEVTDKLETELATEQPEVKEKEALVVTETPEAGMELPPYLNDIKVEGDKVVIDGTAIDLKLAEDAINWREKRGPKAEWLYNRTDEMTPEQALAYRTIQSRSDRYKAQQVKPTTQYPPEVVAAYEAMKASETGRRVLEALDGVSKPQVKEEPKSPAPVKNKVSFAKLAEKLSEGMEDKEEAAALLEEFATEIRTSTESELKSEMKKLARETYEEERWAAEKARREREIVSEHGVLLSDPQYRELAVEHIGPDGFSPIGRLLTYGNPVTGEVMTPKSAYKFLLGIDRGGSGQRINLAPRVEPRRTAAVAQESLLTDEDMTKRNEKEVAQIWLRKKGFIT